MKYITWSTLLPSLALPLFFLVIVGSVTGLWHFFQLPQGDALIGAVGNIFDRYGYPVLFLSAIIEGALVLGFYYPGAFVIFLSVVAAGHNIPKVALVVATVSLAFTIGLSLDYLLGKYGWHRILLKLGFAQQMEKAQRRLGRYGLAAIFLTSWDVNIASFTATAAGTLQYRYRSFLIYVIPALLFWNSLWAVLIYSIGAKALVLVSGGGGYAITVLMIWIAVVIIDNIVNTKRITAKQ